MGEWTRVCSTDEIAKGQTLSFERGEKKILLANLDGRVFATDLACTHADADLSGGFLTDEGIRCPLHLSVFELECGRPQNPPAEKALRTYGVKISSGEVYVEL